MLLQDLRFAVRSFLRAPRFTVPAVIALALGIGATSAIFSVVRGVILQPLPYRDPERIVAIWENRIDRNRPRNVIAAANFVAWRERNKSFELLGMTGPSRQNIVLDGQPQEIAGFFASSDALAAFGTQPQLGRLYTPDVRSGERRTRGRDQPRVLADQVRRQKRRARFVADHEPAAAHGDRRDAAVVHDRRCRRRLPDSVRLDDRAAAPGAGPRLVARHCAPARRRVVRTSVWRDAGDHVAAGGRGAAAQHQLVDHAGADSRADGRSDPSGVVRPERRRIAGAANRVRQRREPAAGAKHGAPPRARSAQRARRRAGPIAAAADDGKRAVVACRRPDRAGLWPTRSIAASWRWWRTGSRCRASNK